MEQNLKSKTLSGLLWSTIERFSLQSVQFVINIIMARLLVPSDYGMIGMLAIFLQISQAFVDGGFSNALIHRKDRTETDFSTVFYFNILIALICYGVLFISAPVIARFYDIPELTNVTRIIAFTLIINSLSAVHRTRLIIDVNFKTQSKISISAAIISGCLGIWMAYTSWGVWALVWQTILNSILLTILFHYFVCWKPQLFFSAQSFRRLFSFGSKLLISGVIHTIYSNLYTIVIGRKFSAVNLGYYTRAEQFAIFPSSNLNAIISRVTFPILSIIQDNDEQLKVVYRKYIRLSSFIIFPLMVGLAALAKPTIELLLTDKWSGVVILLQILCFDWMFDHLSIINLNLLYVKGRSDLALRLEILKKIIATTILFLSIPLGIEGMCWGRVLYSLIATFLNTRYTKSLIGLSLSTQIKDILPFLSLSITMGIIIYIIPFQIKNLIIEILLKIGIGVLYYLGISFYLKFKPINDLLSLIKTNGNK